MRAGFRRSVSMDRVGVMWVVNEAVEIGGLGGWISRGRVDRFMGLGVVVLVDM